MPNAAIFLRSLLLSYIMLSMHACEAFVVGPSSRQGRGRSVSTTELSAAIVVARGASRFKIEYDLVIRPESVLPPLVVLHGGPSVPSNYLRPLENIVTDRSILFYDQLGCGRSDEPDNPYMYSIDLAVEDLDQLLSMTGIAVGPYHLYGQSFGGILAFEFLKSSVRRHGWH